MNWLNENDDGISLLALTKATLSLRTRAEINVNRAVGISAESSLMSSSKAEDVWNKYTGAKNEAGHTQLLAEFRKVLSRVGPQRAKEWIFSHPAGKDRFLVASCLAETSLVGRRYYEALEGAIQCISLNSRCHRGYSLLAELFYLLNCSSLNLSRSAAATAGFLDSPVCNEEWFATAYPELKYVEILSQTDLERLLASPERFSNFVVILSGSDYVIDSFVLQESVHFVGLRETQLSVFTQFVVKKKSTFIGLNLNVNELIEGPSAVDFVLCRIETKKIEYPGICLYGSAYLQTCLLTDCGGGGLLVTGNLGSAVVMSCTIRRNRAAALEATDGGKLLAMNNKLYQNRSGCLLCPLPGQCLIKHNNVCLNSHEGIFVMNVSAEEMTPAIKQAMVEGDEVTEVVIDLDGNSLSQNGSYGVSVQQSINMGIVRIRNNAVECNVFWGMFLDNAGGEGKALVVEKNLVRGNKCGGIFVTCFDSSRHVIAQNVIERNRTAFGSFRRPRCTGNGQYRPSQQWLQESKKYGYSRNLA